MHRPGPGWSEIGLSLLAFAVVVIGLFHATWRDRRTVASAPIIPFTLPTGPVGVDIDPDRPWHLADPYGPGWNHEASVPYRERVLASGRVPLWNPHEACGTPNLAQYLPGLLFPLNWLMYASAPPLGLDLAYLARLVLAGWLTYLLLRVCGIGRTGAFTAGVLYLGCGYMVGGLNLSNVAVEAQYPGLLLGLECVLSRGRRRDLVLVTAVVVGILLGGNPQPAFLAFVMGGAYAAIRVWAVPRGVRARRIGLVTAAHGLGFLLAAPQLLPFLEFVSQAAHNHPARPDLVTLSWPLSIVWIVPGFYRHAYTSVRMAESGGFYGIATLGWIVALAGMAFRARPRLSLLAWAGTLLVSAWYFGLPLLQWVSALPVVNAIDLQKYVACVLCFLPAVAAGIGLDHLFRLAPARAARRLVAATLGALLLTAFFVVAWHRGALAPAAESYLRLEAGDPVAPWLGALLVAAAGVAVISASLVIRPRARRPILLILAGLLVVEVAYHMPDTYPERCEFYRPPEFLAGLRGDRRAFRIYSPDAVLQPNTAGIFGLLDIRYNEPLKIRRYVNLIRQGFSHVRAGTYRAWDPEMRPKPGVPPHPLTVLSVKYVLGTGELVPLGRVPMAGGESQTVEFDSSGGSYDLVGTMAGAGGETGGLEVAEVRTAIVDERRLSASNRCAETTLQGDRAPDGSVRYLLGVQPETDGALRVTSARWCGRPLPLAALRTDVHQRPVPFADGAVRLDALTLLPLPPVAADTRPELTLQGQAQHAPVAVALVAAKTRAVGSILAAADSPRFRLDLSGLAGGRRTLSLTVTGGARLIRLGLEPRGFRERPGFGPIRIFEHEQPLPRAFAVHRVKVATGEAAELDAVLDPGFPIRTCVVLDHVPAGVTLPEAPPAIRPAVTWLHEDVGGERLELEARLAADGLVVLHDCHYPGWTVRVDGRPAELLRANHAFRAVAVPAGVHRVEFRYEPWSWRLGLLAAALGLLGLALLLWRGRFP